MSRRIVIEYDTGAKITGYLARCQPNAGQVQLIRLSKASLLDAEGNHLEEHEEMTIVPNVMTGIRIEEGPQGR